MSRGGHAHEVARHERHTAQLVAFAISAGLHFLFVAFLLRIPGLDNVTQDQSATEVVFIVSQSARQHVTRSESPSKHARKQPRAKPEEPQEALPVRESLPALVSPASAARLDLAIGPASFDFRKNPFAPPAPPLEATAPHFHVPMQDSSFSGRLQTMAQRRTCAELRSALAKDTESTASILNAMRQRDCDI